MFNFKKKNLIYLTAGALLFFAVLSLIPAFKAPVLDTSKYPLKLLNSIRREIEGIIFYHPNFIQNERLKKEIDLLKHRLNALNEAYLENRRLKTLLNFKQESSFKVIAARVIARAADSWSSIIIIDKGAYHGIRCGMGVITHLGFVGRVIETVKSTSKVILVNDPDFSISALDSRSRQEGLVSGALGDFLIMNYISKDMDIKISDTIITSGLTNEYPKGLIIGTVADIGDEFSGLSRYCLIRPAVNLSSLEEVLIIMQ